jgi:hypothetical protein
VTTERYFFFFLAAFFFAIEDLTSSRVRFVAV